jgi:hypothetical protein
MHDLPFPLDPAIIEDPRTTRRGFLNRMGQTTRSAAPVSSSMVMNRRPLANPCFCRTRTRPTALTHRPSLEFIASLAEIFVGQVTIRLEEGALLPGSPPSHVRWWLRHDLSILSKLKEKVEQAVRRK